ncbi:hypothetical protein [Streptomyces sp. NPDC096032]|uniref:hypothetical protein n=1 Tax=Streptomyces sp. NPDC096032 TaxID=3366070 RepID=UPI0038011DEA
MVSSLLRRLPKVSTRGLLHAEQRLAERYADLVRLAYLVLPPALGRHRRVLLAHALVQRTLPAAAPGVPAPRAARDDGPPMSRSLYVPVLREVLALSRRPPLWPGRVPPPRMLLPRLPVVWGLRLSPRAGGADELALSRALSELSATARAAFILLRVERLTEAETRGVLEAAGFGGVEAELRAALDLDAVLDSGAAGILASEEFDPCTVRARPSDLLRRRRRVHLAGIAVLVALITVVTLVVSDGAPTVRAGAGAHRASRPAPAVDDVVRVAPGAWAATSRVDFTAWPARGRLVRDRALLRRALTAWAGDGHATPVSRSAGTAAGPPLDAPHLLYAGPVGGGTVVLLYDGQRLARYREAAGGGGRSLVLARVDDADVTTAAAVALDTSGERVRYLLAPWVAASWTRDLMRPDTPARALVVDGDGVTAPVPLFGPGPRPGAGAGCGSRTVLQLRSSSRIAEHHAFLLAGLGELTAVHLTYTPLPGRGAPARQPREATGPAALLAWARTACAVGLPHGPGVKAVNVWDFAEQDLPDGAGPGVWTCARADTWRGPGEVAVALRTARAGTGEQARIVARARATGACGRFGQHIVVHANWRSPKGAWYVLAAGSRAVRGLIVTGDVTAGTDGATLAVRAAARARTAVRARLAGDLRPIDLSAGRSG